MLPYGYVTGNGYFAVIEYLFVSREEFKTLYTEQRARINSMVFKILSQEQQNHFE